MSISVGRLFDTHPSVMVHVSLELYMAPVKHVIVISLLTAIISGRTSDDRHVCCGL